ncbi:hypothetical protein [Blastopirellula retiformator]|uniref:hypothetical protein n=1 Tax=Blastopirellula retiformator TaxID=2527970 RepID=UPI0011B7512A|nr:hypothetical protein [Blastopirellula retiformator]
MELIDAHLDGEPLSDADSDALTEWIKRRQENADDAFRRIFLHSYLRQQLQALPPLPDLENESPQSSLDGSSGPPQRFSRWSAVGAVLALIAIVLGGLLLPTISTLPQPRRSHPFAYEGFDYPPDEVPPPLGDWPATGGLDGRDGGEGFAAAWVESGSLVSIIEANPSDHPWTPQDMRQFGQLGYSDRFGNILQSVGNQLRSSAGPLSDTHRKIDVSAASASLRHGDKLGADGSQLWISFLAQSFDSSGDGRYAYLQLGDDDAGLRLGKLRNVPNGNWSVAAVTNRAEINLRASEKPSGEGVIIVARIEFRPGAEQATIWINPDLTEVPQDTDSTLRLPTPDFRFDTISIRGRYSTDFDEIRLGETFQDVTPIAPKSAIP